VFLDDPMAGDLLPFTTRFRWSALRGRCRRHLVAGVLILAAAGGYAWFAGAHMARRGSDERAFDQPLVRLAVRLTPLPVHLFQHEPRNDRELYLATVIKDQRDMITGLTVLLLRMIIAVTAGGIGLVLLTAGSTEWELRSGPALSQ
jgi:hypothetical protein